MATVAASEAGRALEKLGMSAADSDRKSSASLRKQDAGPTALSLRTKVSRRSSRHLLMMQDGHML